MTEFELALSKLQKVKKIGNEYLAQCPCHKDKVQSLSIKEGNNGKALLYCHAGCDYSKLIDVLGLRKEIDNTEPQVVATYDYTNASGELLYQVVRYSPKAFKQRRPVKDGWEWDLKGIESTFYRLPEVLEAVENETLIFSVEGEKDVETLRKHGQVATTINGGSNKTWTPQMIELLYNANVTIIPDNDKSGKDYATRCAVSLYGWCKSLKIVPLPVEPKEDVTDYLRSNPIKTLLGLVNETPQYVPVGAISRDEFFSLKGQIIYLYNQYMKLKERSKSKVLNTNRYNNYK